MTMDVRDHSYYLFIVTTIVFPPLVCHVIIRKGSDEEMADKEESEKTIAEDLVVTKYKMAGDIVNRKQLIRGLTINLMQLLIVPTRLMDEWYT
jgi:hypothetical protein